MDDKSLVIRVPRRWVRVAIIVGVTALVVAPLTAVASHTFNDVPDTHTFHNDITWLADAGGAQGSPEGATRPAIPASVRTTR